MENENKSRSTDEILDRLMDIIRENMRNVKLSEKNEPEEITVKIVYPGGTVTHTFKGGEKRG